MGKTKQVIFEGEALVDSNLEPVNYGDLLDFTWWENLGGEIELHLKCKIRQRKSGDIFEFVEDAYGRPCKFTHRLSALNWTTADLLLIKSEL